MHRDLKPENILFMRDNTVKLADFGMAHDCMPDYAKYTNSVTTACYRDPQLLLGTRMYGQEIDMWSVACILGELLFCAKMIPADPKAKAEDERENSDFYLNCIWSLCGTPTYEEVGDWPADVRDNVMKVVRGPKVARAIQKKLGTNNMNVMRAKFFTRAAVDLLEKMLVISPKKRLSAEQALQHAYFSSEYPRPYEKHLMVPLDLKK
jgi:cell division cycle 2-like protein